MIMRHPNEPDRVRRYSTPAQLQKIDRRLEHTLRLYAAQPPEIIDERIRQLREEWSIERYLQINVAAVGLTTALLAVTRNRRWGFATCAGLGFFLWHALDGFDPPLPLLRRLGVRSRSEIDRELFGLKVLRGDFDEVEPRPEPEQPAGVEAALRASGVAG